MYKQTNNFTHPILNLISLKNLVWIWYFSNLLIFMQGAVIGIDDEDDSTFTITVDQKTFHFQGTIEIF